MSPKISSICSSDLPVEDVSKVLEQPELRLPHTSGFGVRKREDGSAKGVGEDEQNLHRCQLDSSLPLAFDMTSHNTSSPPSPARSASTA